MATKFVHEKWEKINCNNCECEQITKFCSVVMKEKFVEKLNTDSMKVKKSHSIDQINDKMNYNFEECEANKVEYTISASIESGTSHSEENYNGR